MLSCLLVIGQNIGMRVVGIQKIGVHFFMDPKDEHRVGDCWNPASFPLKY